MGSLFSEILCMRVPGANGCQASQGRGLRFAELRKLLDSVCHTGLCECVPQLHSHDQRETRCKTGAMQCGKTSPVDLSKRLAAIEHRPLDVFSVAAVRSAG